MTDRELMQQALDAIRIFREWEMGHDYDSNRDTVLVRAFAAEEALETALAQPEQEPVAWRFRETKNKAWSISDDGYYISCKRTSGYIIEPLYTAPPQRKPLTEEEIGLLTTDPRFAHIETPTLAEFARAVIAKATGEKE